MAPPAPVAVPPGARQVLVGQDGTLSADGQPAGQIGLWLPQDPLTLRHEAGVMFSSGPLVPATASLRQGMLEDSNVEPVVEIARMIEVQRAYELGQTFLQQDDDRSRRLIETLGRQP